MDAGAYRSRLGPHGTAASRATRELTNTESDDEPSVPDERVSSHEIGHILGLHDVLDDSSRLMLSGTDGTALTAPEIAIARSATIGIHEGQGGSDDR